MLAAAFYDLNPLFWLSVGCGVLVLTWLVAEAVRRDFLAAWAAIFFAGALLIFFAGSARYLLPSPHPSRSSPREEPPRWLTAGFALQMILSLGLATANYQHWDGYRQFAKTLAAGSRPTSRLGGCRMGPALLPGIGRRAASVARSSDSARRYHRLQRAGSSRHGKRSRRAGERRRDRPQHSAAPDLA